MRKLYRNHSSVAGITAWAGSTLKMLFAMIAVKIYKTSKQTRAMQVSRDD